MVRSFLFPSLKLNQCNFIQQNQVTYFLALPYVKSTLFLPVLVFIVFSHDHFRDSLIIVV